MKKYLNYKIPVFGAIVIFLSSCYSEGVSPIDSPDDNSIATFTPAGDYSSIKEGDVLEYEISVDKMVANDVQFSVVFGENSVLGPDDVSITGGLLGAFNASTTISVEILADDFPEVSEAASFEISAAEDLTWNFQLSPLSQVVSVSADVPNVNDDTSLTVAFGWSDPEHITDFDFLVEHADLGSWGAAATSANPEVDLSVWKTDDDGTYYYGVDPYDVPDGDIPFTVSIGYPDGSVEFFEGTFNVANLGDYTQDTFSAWGAPMYRILTVVKSGENFSVTFEF